MQKLPIVLAGVGLGFLVLGVIVGWVVVPNVIEDQIIQQVQIRNGTETYEKWTNIPLPVYLKFYIFNVTNPREVEQGEKPIFQEVGPYVYRETRTKVDLSISEDETVVQYRQKVDYFFEEKMSEGSEDDIVRIINIPFVIVSSMVPSWSRWLANIYILRFKETLFVEKTVSEILFEGYYQPMLDELQNITGQDIIKHGKFGLYAGTVATMLSQISTELANLVIKILQIISLRTESLIRKKVRVGDLTFKGFPVPFYAIPLEIVSNIGPTFNISVPDLPPEFGGGRFGFYNGRNGSDDGVFEVHSGVGDSTQFGQILTWNGNSKLEWWGSKDEDGNLMAGSEYCNMINGSDGSVFPPFVKRDRVLRIYNPDLCRSLYLTYDHDVQFMGISGYRFTAPTSMLEDPRINQDNLCFCPEPGENYDGCLKAGAIQLSPCRDGAPVSMSTPHFYGGSEEYVNQSLGLRPRRELHETFIDIEPNTGLPLQASKRIQINVELKKMPGIDAFKNVPEMLFPVLWADEFAALDDENADTLKRQLITPLKIVGIAKWTVLGISYLLIGAAVAICTLRMRRRKKLMYRQS